MKWAYVLGAVQSTLIDIFGMSKVSAKWVPQMLTDDQKRTQLDISRYLLSRYEDDPADCIKRVVTQDEIYGFTTLTQSHKCRANNGCTLTHPS